MFLFLGADPNTDWLKDCPIAVAEHGFVCTGPGVTQTKTPYSASQSPDRMLMPQETTQQGVFAVGDVRAGSVKRVASAVGEGSIVVSQLHTFLAESRLA